MRRFDLTVGAALMLLAMFVVREVVRTRAHFSSIGNRTSSYGVARTDSTATASRPPERRPVARTRIMTPVADEFGDVRRRVELAGHDTYISDIVDAHDSALVRWPDRVTHPLRVWVQPWSDLPGFHEEFLPVVRRAFQTWSGTGIPVTFSFITDSATAEVHVTWTDRFREPISGKTIWAHDEDQWIIDAQIQLALQHQSGQMLDTTAISAISLHEVGHLLGLDHTSDTSSIMASKVRVRSLSPADRATVQLLYRLPAGSMRTPRHEFP